MSDLGDAMSDSEDLVNATPEGEEVKLSLKVFINKEKTKVLFAEVDSYFTDSLLSFLTLPLGMVVSIMEKHYEDEAPLFGSVTTLYRSVANLDLFMKYCLLNPRNSLASRMHKLKLDISATEPAMKYPERGDMEYFGSKRARNVKTARKLKNTKASRTQAQAIDDGDAGVFTLSTASFVISDDLRITPIMPESVLQTLMSAGITDMDGAELKMVNFGFNELKDLLKGSLVSESPLTDIILDKSNKSNCAAQDLPPQMEKNLPSSNSKKMSIRAIVQESTSKFLIAQAGGDFVEFLFSFLILPLGSIECLFGSNTSLKNIDNLYESIAVLDEKYLKAKDTRALLLKPTLSHYDMPPNQILPLVEAGFNPTHQTGGSKYVKGLAMFNVTDDLTVTPFSFASSVSVLSRFGIPLSDVKEMDLQIGVEEAMNILKASLTSTSALTDGLIKPLLKKKQPKQELRL